MQPRGCNLSHSNKSQQFVPKRAELYWCMSGHTVRTVLSLHTQSKSLFVWYRLGLQSIAHADAHNIAGQ
eukprot:scaffold184155_cov17-Prasinocladus_malaysianus.AAC.1